MLEYQDSPFEDDSGIVIDELHFYRRNCFTENYLIFNLNETNPQQTETYMDKEEDLLDFCRSVNFDDSKRKGSSNENALNSS